MIHKKNLLKRAGIVCAICLSMAFSVNLSAGIRGKGKATIFNNNEGSARSQALKNALRDAVQQGVGLLLDSTTITKNWTVIRDEIHSSARGFVNKYKILKDKKAQGAWYIEIDAEVSTGKIKGRLKELRILHKKMGNKRLMVIYRAEHPTALSPDHSAVLSALTSITSKLNAFGFRVFDQRSLGHISSKLSQVGSPVESWIRIANENQVDILAEFELVTGSKKPFSNSAYSFAKVSIQMRVYDVSTGRLISSARTLQKQMTNAKTGSFDWDNALSKAGEKAGESVAIETTDQIIEYYKSVGDIGNSFLIIFKGFTEDEEDLILDIMENLDGYQSLSEIQNKPQLLKVEYFTTMEKSRLRRKIRLSCKTKGIRLKTKEIAGNRFIFIK